jgi:hypothetical protein
MSISACGDTTLPEGTQHAGKLERDHGVHPGAAVAALEQLELVARHRRSLDVQVRDLGIQHRIQCGEVQAARITGQRPVCVEVPQHTTAAVRPGARLERQQRPARRSGPGRQESERLDIGLVAPALLGVGRQLSGQEADEAPRPLPRCGKHRQLALVVGGDIDVSADVSAGANQAAGGRDIPPAARRSRDIERQLTELVRMQCHERRPRGPRKRARGVSRLPGPPRGTTLTRNYSM